MKKAISIASLTIMISACAGNPDKMSTTYVSPLKYKDYDCEQIASEMETVNSRSLELYHQLKKERTADNWQMGLGLLVFWPSLFFLEGGDGPEATEYSRLKGDFEALRQNSVSKKCDINIMSPEELVKEEDKKDKKKKSKK